MKVCIKLFLLFVVTSQAYQLPLNRALVARQGDSNSNGLFLNEEPLYEKFKKFSKQYAISTEVPDPETLLVPDVYKPSDLRLRDSVEILPGLQMNSRSYPALNHPRYNAVAPRVRNLAPNKYPDLASSRFTRPAIHTRFPINESEQKRKDTLADIEARLLEQAKANRAARLAKADREALSKLSKEDRKVLESGLSQGERQALLAKLEDGQLDDLLSREENRFGGFSPMSGLSGAVVQVGASAGGYIGGKLAGTLGAKLGSAAGAYLGAAAASRFFQKTESTSEIVSTIVSEDKLQYGASYGGGYGAVMVKNE